MSVPERVAIVSVNAEGSVTGNEISLQRVVGLLRERGVAVEVVRPAEDVAGAAERLATEHAPQLVHGFHARRSGPRAAFIARELNVPLVMSVTGTDVGRDALDPSRAPIVREVLRSCAAVLCGHAEEADRVRAIAGSGPAVFVVPKSVAIPTRQPAPALRVGLAECLLLHVAHVRPVKNALVAIDVAARLRAQGLAVRLLFLGDVLDERYAAVLRRAAGGDAEWEELWRPAVPHDAMGGYYAAADVVLNTSDVEGASNAVLEAMAHGCAVVASAVSGNAVLVGTSGTRGLLYPVHDVPGGGVEHGRDALEKILRRLAVDAGARRRLGDAAREWVHEYRSADAEARALFKAYESVLPPR